jgi:hypothetical protein
MICRPPKKWEVYFIALYGTRIPFDSELGRNILQSTL